MDKQTAVYLDLIIGYLFESGKTIYYRGALSQAGVPWALNEELLAYLQQENLVNVSQVSRGEKIISLSEKGYIFAKTETFVSRLNEAEKQKEKEVDELDMLCTRLRMSLKIVNRFYNVNYFHRISNSF